MSGSVHGTPKGWKALQSRKRKPKSKMNCYARRDGRLSELGYAGYQEYLKSDQWRQVRTRKLKRFPQCLVCERPAAQAHHMDYGFEVLLGLDDARLVSLCDGCHRLIEFAPDGSKRRLCDANKELRRLAWDAGRKQWFSDLGKAKRKRQAKRAGK